MLFYTSLCVPIFIMSSLCILVDTVEYTKVTDVLQEKSINISMEPLHFKVMTDLTAATLYTKSTEKVYRLYCDDSYYSSKVNLSATEIKWRLNLPMKDHTIMVLLLNEGILCKAITDTSIFPFLIYTDKHSPSIKPIAFERSGKHILHTKHHWWLQGITIVSTFACVITIFVTVYCCFHSSKVCLK